MIIDVKSNVTDYVFPFLATTYSCIGQLQFSVVPDATTKRRIACLNHIYDITRKECELTSIKHDCQSHKELQTQERVKALG